MVQVKGGEKLNPGMVRDLMGTVKNENAAIGLLITLAKPTQGMQVLASHSDFYESPIWNKKFPRIQIRTVEQIFQGNGFDLPWAENPSSKAELAKAKGNQKPLL